MLLWEALRVPAEGERADASVNNIAGVRTQLLPFETRCAAMTKSGRRCRGRIRKGTEFCPFHDPTVSPERRRQIASKGGRNHHRLACLRDGYLRKLSSRAAVGEAMDRLYREVRLGVVTPEMGTVLFSVLTRVLDSGIVSTGRAQGRSSRPSKADKIKPRLSELLTRAEQAAWRRAVANAPVHLTGRDSRQRPAPATRRRAGTSKDPRVVGSPGNAAVQFAS